ncbi:relaxase/mobilization nuclease domain-containing protein [Streptomyces graminilatus]|uniref:relaxase/mobilization nuclease domain-containing protein n=1 Tax=Streptomyces graminilatus TaxID=1464070 RepID=UPI0006E1602C|nr:relaxase/mobilization nuclease domain-containing protein [Streptomyces graminilatus]
MIANITKGKKAVGALVYDFGPGRRDEHVNPRIVAGNVTGTPLQVARMIDHTARRRPEIAAPIWRCSLSLPDEDGILPDAQWGDIAAKFIAEMGFDGAPWVAVRHGDDHIHLTVSRVDWSGQLLTDRWDYRRAREAADALEEENGLVRARDRFRAEGPQVRNAELEASNRRRGPEPAAPPEREELRRIVREVRDASRGLGRDAFESGLTDFGVSFRANVASTGRMNGYSFTLDGLVDGDGAQVWFPASKVAKDLRWAALHQVLGDGPAPTTLARSDGDVPTPEQVEEAVDQAEADVAEFARQAAKILQRGQAERGVVPADHPALSTDPAQRLLEQWRMKQRGEPVPAERLVPAESVPAWDDKRRRPYGALGAEKLKTALQKAEREAERLAHSRDAAQRAARSWDGLATGAVTGEQVQALHKLNARLAKAEPHLKVVREQMERARQADATADAARKIWKEADARKNLGRVELWRLKTSKKAEENKASTAGEAIHLYVDQGTKARRTAGESHKEAVKVSGLADPVAERERVTEYWPELLREAQARDQAHGVARREAMLTDAETYERRRTAEQAKAAALRQEQALRTSMPEAQGKAEARARSAAARPTKDGKKTRKAGTGRRYTGPRPDERPPHLRQPPPPKGGRGQGL